MALSLQSLVMTNSGAPSNDFCKRNGFNILTSYEKERLLQNYRSIPARQVEKSVVVVDSRWTGENQRR